MIEFTKLMQEQFNKMCSTKKLFRSSITGNEVWSLYINSFKEQGDPIFRDPSSSTHNCNLCKNFIRRYGNIVAIDENYNIITLFDITPSNEFFNVARVISEILKNSTIINVFIETFNELNSLPYEKCNKNNSKFQLGVDKNVKRYNKEEADKYGVVKKNEIFTFNHLHLFIPAEFISMTSFSAEAIMAEYRDSKNVFQRTMEEIPLDTLELVKDLITQNSLLNGEAYLSKVESFIAYKKEYDSLSQEIKDSWCWITSYKLPIAKFKNELIGVLCTDLAEGEELNSACKKWNVRVDPINYMRATTPITQKQINDAKMFVEENGYVESFDRRYATIDDIKVSEILHSNVGDGKIKAVSIFDNVKSSSTRHKRSEFDGVEEVTIDKFMKDILPSCTAIEAFVTSKHENNFVSLTTSNVENSKPMFKWSNNYSWTFNGNLTSKSQIKEAVKLRGGKTEGILNVRLAFPNTESDYDLHIVEPDGNHIYYGNRRSRQDSSGVLDLDAQGADGLFPPEKRVENVIYTNSAFMPKGKYLVFVHNYSTRDNNFGFTIEVEIQGEVTTFNYNKFIPSQNKVDVCYIKFNGNDFEIIPIIPIGESNLVSKEIYGLQTNEFYKVNLVCLSPNYWGENNIGNKHYFFMLENCKCSTPIKSFHPENLISELTFHRKVLDVLSATTMIQPTDKKQLSGLGFNATIKDELIVKLYGSHKRVIKIKF